MWIARFKLKDDEDIYSPLCEKYGINFYAVPYTSFIKNKKIHTFVGGVISGGKENKDKFVANLKKDDRIDSVEQHYDFIFIHATHLESREAKAELQIFYNPQYIRAKPVLVSSDGWEYWEVACLDREELNKLVNTAVKYYHGQIFSMKQDKINRISSLTLSPDLTEHQLEAIKLAYKGGYYNYPRDMTLTELSKKVKRAYSTFQEHLSKAENKLIGYFLRYR